MSLRKKTGRVLLFAILVLSSIQAQVPKPPPSKVDNFREVLHGVEIIDPYHWLEDQDHPETRAWIDAQTNTLTRCLCCCCTPQLFQWRGRFTVFSLNITLPLSSPVLLSDDPGAQPTA